MRYIELELGASAGPPFPPSQALRRAKCPERGHYRVKSTVGCLMIEAISYQSAQRMRAGDRHEIDRDTVVATPFNPIPLLPGGSRYQGFEPETTNRAATARLLKRSAHCNLRFARPGLARNLRDDVPSD